MWLSTTLLIIVIFLVFTIFVGAARSLRRRAERLPDRPLNVDFSIADLHEMRRRGQLTPDEFERARQVVLANATKRAAQTDTGAAHGFLVLQRGDHGAAGAEAGAEAGRDAGDVAGGDASSRDAR